MKPRGECCCMLHVVAQHLLLFLMLHTYFMHFMRAILIIATMHINSEKMR